MKKYMNFTKTLLFVLFTISSFTGNLFAEDITKKISELKISASVDFFNPPEYMLDEDDATACGFNPGYDSGWIEFNLDRKMEIYGLTLDGTATSENLEMKIEYQDTDGWKPFTLGRVDKENLFNSFIDISYDRVVTGKLRIVLSGGNLSETKLYSLALSGTDPREVLHKIGIKNTVSSTGASHFYSADYLTDNNARTNWIAYPHILSEFPENFTSDEIDGLDDVQSELDMLLGLKHSSQLRYSYYFEMDAELELENSGNVDFINLYFSEENQGDFTLSVLSEGSWSDIYFVSDADSPDAGWKQIPVGPDPGLIGKIRVSYSGDYIKLGGLGEIEIWGRGPYTGKEITSLLIPEGTNLSTPSFFSTMLEDNREYRLEVELHGFEGESLELEFNGASYDAVRKIGRFNGNLYSVSIDRDYVLDDGNYITLPELGAEITVEAIRFVRSNDSDYCAIDNSLNDQFLFSAGSGETSTVFDFGRSEFINRLNIYSLNGDYADIELYNNGAWETLSDFTSGDSLSAFDVNRIGSRLLIEKPAFSDIGEAEILGSPLENGAPDVRILWPGEGDILSKGFTNSDYMKGFIDNPDAIVTVNGIPSSQSGHTFWIPLRNFEVDENGILIVTAEATDPEGLVSTHEIQIFEDGSIKVEITPIGDKIFTDEKQITFHITSPSNMTLYIDNGEDIWQLAGSKHGVSQAIPLNEGFNLITIKGAQKNSGRLFRIIQKRIIRNSEGISINVYSPASETWINKLSTIIEGSVIGAGGRRQQSTGRPHHR